jgi:glutamine amidotransferase
MRVAIIRYNAGNVRSVETALERLAVSYVVTDHPEELLSAERVIFPGVGEAASAMRYLTERGLDRVIADIKAPLLGICLGMQLLGEYSEEGDTRGFGIIPISIRRFTKPRKIPHMGWSRVRVVNHPLFEGIDEEVYFYFVHSYRADVSDFSIATCVHEETFAAAVARNNFVGVQFHPERSGVDGERVLRNFLSWRGV